MSINDGIIGISDIWAEWMYYLGTIWSVMVETEVVDGVNLLSFILGSGIVLVISFSITKWVIDFLP